MDCMQNSAEDLLAPVGVALHQADKIIHEYIHIGKGV